jgi:hypothetical protein
MTWVPHQEIPVEQENNSSGGRTPDFVHGRFLGIINETVPAGLPQGSDKVILRNR